MGTRLSTLIAARGTGRFGTGGGVAEQLAQTAFASRGSVVGSSPIMTIPILRAFARI